MLVLFASGRAMNRFLEHVTDLRLMLLVQGDQPRYRLVELHRNGGKRRAQRAGGSAVLCRRSRFKGDLLSGAYP